MQRQRWITPDAIPAATICRVLFIPDEQEIRASVLGAISELIYASNWEQVGAVTPVQMASAMDAMFWAFVESECGVTAQVDSFDHRVATNTNGGTITANTPTDITFASVGVHNAGNVTLDAQNFVCSPGLYEFDIQHSIRGDALYRAFCWVANASGAAFIQEGADVVAAATTEIQIRCTGVVNVPTTQAFVYRMQSSDTLVNIGLGSPKNNLDHQELYGQAIWRRIANAL